MRHASANERMTAAMAAVSSLFAKSSTSLADDARTSGHRRPRSGNPEKGSLIRITKRLLGIVVATVLSAGGVAFLAEPAHAATDCSDSWHYITHGETGRNLRPIDFPQFDPAVFASAVPGTDYWNQQFLFCRDPLWGANHYAIFANRTGAYCYAFTQMSCSAPRIENTDQLFEIRRYDSTWWTIRSVNRHFPQLQWYYSADRTNDYPEPNAIVKAPGALTGNHLFRITPSNLAA